MVRTWKFWKQDLRIKPILHRRSGRLAVEPFNHLIHLWDPLCNALTDLWIVLCTKLTWLHRRKSQLFQQLVPFSLAIVRVRICRSTRSSIRRACSMKEGQNCGECWQWVLDCSNVVNLLYELAVMICNLCFGIHHDKSNLGPACMKKSESKILACKKDVSTITSFYIFYCFVLHTFITSCTKTCITTPPPAPNMSPQFLLTPGSLQESTSSSRSIISCILCRVVFLGGSVSEDRILDVIGEWLSWTLTP